MFSMVAPLFSVSWACYPVAKSVRVSRVHVWRHLGWFITTCMFPPCNAALGVLCHSVVVVVAESNAPKRSAGSQPGAWDTRVAVCNTVDVEALDTKYQTTAAQCVAPTHVHVWSLSWATRPAGVMQHKAALGLCRLGVVPGAAGEVFASVCHLKCWLAVYGCMWLHNLGSRVGCALSECRLLLPHGALVM